MKTALHNRIVPLLILTIFCLSTQALALDKSRGVYRIPYANGTSVKITNDHKKHTPKGRIDMVGEKG